MASSLFRVLLITNLFLAGPVRSQSFVEVADQAHDIVRYLDARPTSDGGALIYAWNNSENGHAAGFWLRRVGPDGAMLWTRPTLPVFDLELHAAGLLYTVTTPGCDVTASEYFLNAIDTEGDELFVSSYLVYPGFEHIDVRLIADNSTDKLALFGDEWLVITSLSGDSLTSRQLPVPYTKGTWLSSGELLLIGASELKRLDGLGNDLSSTSMLGPVLDVKALDEGYLLLFDDRIEAYDNTLVLTSTAAFDTTLGVPKRFVQGMDTCMVHTTDGVVVIDELLAVQDTIPFPPLPGHIIEAVLPSGERYMTVGSVLYDRRTGPTATWSRSSGIIRTYDRAGNSVVEGPDVQLEIISLEPEIAPGANTFIDVNATVRITNLGADAVEQLMVTHQPSPWPFICGIVGTSFSLTELDLQPGESVDLELHGLDLLFNTQPVGGPYDAEICMWALSPNAMVDRDASDNYACATLGDVITTIGEVADDAAFSAYPNPTRDKVYLVGLPEDLSGYCELIDALGSTRSVSVSQGSTGVVEADLSHMPSGTYRLVYRNEHRLLWTTVCLVR